jgi:hypothetical protein
MRTKKNVISTAASHSSMRYGHHLLSREVAAPRWSSFLLAGSSLAGVIGSAKNRDIEYIPPGSSAPQDILHLATVSKPVIYSRKLIWTNR